MNRDEIIDQAAKVLSRAWKNMHTNESLGYQRMLAGALADVGLLAQPLPTREEIANALHGDNCPDDPDPDESCSCGAGDYDRMGDIVLALLKGQDR